MSQTGYVCPMTCPKGLRNGPCGGTENGACEVLPDQPCVWLRIRDRDYNDESGLHTPFNESLLNTSSIGNFVTGKDSATRQPQPFSPATDRELAPASLLAQRFSSGHPVITYEIASPRSHDGLGRVAEIVERLSDRVDAINTTTNAGGVPSLHSLETARVVAAGGVPPIVQFCGRDQDANDFQEQIITALDDGFANILVLTGDWNPQTERELHPKHWFPMDSLQMVDILAAASGFPKAAFIGVASTAYTKPMVASLDRFNSKLRAGAHFTQTQVVTETALFSEWLARARQTDAGRRCKILASVPLIGKSRPYKILTTLPGVHVASHFQASLHDVENMAEAGIKAARSLILELLTLDIDGIHLMNFGMPLDAVIDLLDEIRE